MKLNDAFVIDIEVKKNYVPQAPNQADKRDIVLHQFIVLPFIYNIYNIYNVQSVIINTRTYMQIRLQYVKSI